MNNEEINQELKQFIARAEDIEFRRSKILELWNKTSEDVERWSKENHIKFETAQLLLSLILRPTILHKHDEEQAEKNQKDSLLAATYKKIEDQVTLFKIRTSRLELEYLNFIEEYEQWSKENKIEFEVYEESQERSFGEVALRPNQGTCPTTKRVGNNICTLTSVRCEEIPEDNRLWLVTCIYTCPVVQPTIDK